MVADDGPRDAEAAAESAAGATTKRLRDLLEQRVPLAEIAVRLGTTLADAQARVDRLSGAPAPHPLPRPVPARPTTAADATQPPPLEDKATLPPPPPREATQPEDTTAPRMPRRTFLALAATGLAGLAGGAFLSTRPTRNTPTIVRAERALPPAPTPTPSPLAVLRPADGLFEQLAYEPGQPLGAEQGIFFLRTRGEGAGGVEGWRLREGATEGGEAPAYRASAGGRFVAAGGALQDRRSGRSFRWPSDQLRLVGLSDAAVLFESLTAGGQGAPKGTGRYVLTNDELQARAEFDVDGVPTQGLKPSFEPDGRRVFLPLNRRYTHPTLYHLDGASSTARVVFQPETPPTQLRVFFAEATRMRDSAAIMLPFSYWPSRPPRPLGYGIFTTFVSRLGWDGEQLGITRIPVDRVFLSPDGSLAAGELVLFTTVGGSRRFEPTSTVLVVDGATGRPRFRIRSARLNYGDELGGDRWLADSSALVVQTRTGGQVGYSLVSAEGTSIDPLLAPPSSETTWFGHEDVRGAVPAPNDPALFAFGRTHVFDRAAERWHQLNLGERAPAHLDPWSESDDEAVLVRERQHHDLRPLLADLDETRIEHAPFDALG